MEVEHDVGAIGDEESVVDGKAEALHGSDLLEERGDVDDGAVAHDALVGGLEEADGNQVEGDALAVDDDRVAGVGAAGGSAADIVATGVTGGGNPYLLPTVSTNLPFPSSPHWEPRTTSTLPLDMVVRLDLTIEE